MSAPLLPEVEVFEPLPGIRLWPADVPGMRQGLAGMLEDLRQQLECPRPRKKLEPAEMLKILLRPWPEPSDPPMA
jgi:hypothetical protein